MAIGSPWSLTFSLPSNPEPDQFHSKSRIGFRRTPGSDRALRDRLDTRRLGSLRRPNPTASTSTRASALSIRGPRAAWRGKSSAATRGWCGSTSTWRRATTLRLLGATRPHLADVRACSPTAVQGSELCLRKPPGAAKCSGAQATLTPSHPANANSAEGPRPSVVRKAVMRPLARTPTGACARRWHSAVSSGPPRQPSDSIGNRPGRA